MDISSLLETFMPILIWFIMIIIIIRMVKGLIGSFGAQKQPTMGILPTSVGERLKKYIVKASKSNPTYVKELYLRRTEYNPGGYIGRVVGVLPTKYATRFIFKNHRLGWMKLMYCPTHMHSSIHSRQVIINGVGLDNAGGFYYPLPGSAIENSKAFQIFKNALNIDLKRMQIVDVMQLEQEQTYASISGPSDYDEITSGAPEDIIVEEVPTREEETYA